MEQAPERIWVNLDDCEDGCCPVEDGLDGDGKFFCAATSTRYIRADLVPQWQPIETAPKDGTVILARYIMNNGYHVYETVFWDKFEKLELSFYKSYPIEDGKDGWWCDVFGSYNYMPIPEWSEWQPLPAPPSP